MKPLLKRNNVIGAPEWLSYPNKAPEWLSYPDKATEWLSYSDKDFNRNDKLIFKNDGNNYIVDEITDYAIYFMNIKDQLKRDIISIIDDENLDFLEISEMIRDKADFFLNFNRKSQYEEID